MMLIWPGHYMYMGSEYYWFILYFRSCVHTDLQFIYINSTFNIYRGNFIFDSLWLSLISINKNLWLQLFYFLCITFCPSEYMRIFRNIIPIKVTFVANKGIYTKWNVVFIGGARGVMVIVVGNGHGDTSSNPGRGWLHFTLHLGKVWI